MPKTVDPSPPKTTHADEEIVQQLKSWDVVAFLGLLTFVTNLAFEYGRAAFWGFPVELVHFSPENAFLTFVRLAVGGLLLGLVIQFAMISNWYRIIVSLLAVLAITFGSWRLGQQWGGLGLVAAIAGAGYCVWAAALLWKKDIEKGPASIRFIQLLGQGGIALTVALVLVPYAALALGYFGAANQDEFLVTTKVPRQLVLATYGSQAVCATLNTSDGKSWISPSFALVELSSDNLGEIATEHLGHVEVRAR